MKLILKTSLLVLFILFGFRAMAQDIIPEKKLVQFSGTVFSADSLQEEISYVTILVKSSRRGTVSDVKGYFSIPIYSTDTLIFSALGYASYEFALEKDANAGRLFMNIKLNPISYQLKDVVVYGLTKDNFKRAFLTADLPESVVHIMNPKILPTDDELRLPPPIGLHLSPSEILKDVPFIKNISDKKRHRKRMKENEQNGVVIPEMK